MRKKGNSVIYDNTDEPGGHHGKYKPEKDQYHIVSFICGVLKKENLN